MTDLIGYYSGNISFSCQEIVLICLERCRFNLKNAKQESISEQETECIECRFTSNLSLGAFCTHSFGCFEFCNNFARMMMKMRRNLKRKSQKLRPSPRRQQPRRLNPETVLRVSQVVFLIMLQESLTCNSDCLVVHCSPWLCELCVC